MTPLDMLGLSIPLIQAPMAGVSTPAMAAAVSNAGALGSIAVGAIDAPAARDMIAAVRARTDRPFNVNLFAHAPSGAGGAMACHPRTAFRPVQRSAAHVASGNLSQLRDG
jgi:NAD(P)H-dependent flavin oxidoreductase YrpB (nitropropane dioxygenase family)